MKRIFKITGAAAAVAAFAIPLFSFELFSGSPRWPLSGGFHYIADLNTTSFPAGSVWDSNAQFSLSDWRDVGSTNFTPGIRRTNSDFNNHGNGDNSWVWLNRPADSWLGITFVRWSGSTMQDCDIWYNSRPDYTWTNGLFDPCEYRSYWPIEFRNVARHETGHAIGFAHEDDTLSNMNSISTHGAGIAHVQGSGIMPHATDKHGGRFLYSGSGTTRNVMATNWREPTSSSSGARQEGEETGTWPADTTRTIEFWLENQSNVSITGGASGIQAGIYLSTNSIISTADTRVWNATFGGDWPAHAQGRYTPTVRVPDTMPAGSYYVGAYFDNGGFVAETGSGATESDNTCVLGRVNVTNTLRTINVTAVNGSGVTIQVDTTDSQNRGNGAVPFSRTYWGSSQRVTLTAPSSVGNNDFRFWRLNGAIQRSGTALSVTMNRTHNAEAVYWDNQAGREFSFGRPGCAGTNGVPSHTVTHGNGRQGNQQGTPTSYNVTSARPFTSAFLHLGLSRTNWNGFRLPLSLNFVGMPGCWLNHDLVVTEQTATDSRGSANYRITWPVDQSAVGLEIYTTFAILDLGANPTSVVHSNSMATVIGGNLP